MGSASFWSAAIASVTSTALFYPLEMVETRMQADLVPAVTATTLHGTPGATAEIDSKSASDDRAESSSNATAKKRSSSSYFGGLVNLWNALQSVIRFGCGCLLTTKVVGLLLTKTNNNKTL